MSKHTELDAKTPSASELYAQLFGDGSGFVDGLPKCEIQDKRYALKDKILFAAGTILLLISTGSLMVVFMPQTQTTGIVMIKLQKYQMHKIY